MWVVGSNIVIGLYSLDMWSVHLPHVFSMWVSLSYLPHGVLVHGVSLSYLLMVSWGVIIAIG